MDTIIDITTPRRLSCWPHHTNCAHRKYIGRAVTLYDEPARIVIDSEGYAHVTPLDPDCESVSYPPLDPDRKSVSYSWIAVFAICDLHSGRFGG